MMTFNNIFIHPCDHTVEICYLLWLCDTAIYITYLISHSYSLNCHMVIKGYFRVGCIINTKLPSCVDKIRCTSLGFPCWCPESTRPTDSCFQDTSCENLMMYGGLCQHTWLVLYLCTLIFLFTSDTSPECFNVRTVIDS